MLIDFTVSNFRSIKEEMTLSLLASKAKENPGNVFASPREKKINLLRSAAIYGANASGKSNVLKALDNFRHFILNSTDLNFDQKIPYYHPFKLDKLWADKPAMFEIEFIGDDNIRYRYCVTFDKKEIWTESLVFFPKGREANLFSREKGKQIRFGDYFKGPARAIEQQLLDNNLFLSKAANSNNKVAQNVYLYFKNRIVTLIDQNFLPFYTEFTTKCCIDDKSNMNGNIIGQLLKLADIRIDSLGFKESPVSEEMKRIADFLENELGMKQAPDESMNSTKHEPVMYHEIFDGETSVGRIDFSLKEESNGTIKLYSIAGHLFDALSYGKILIVDELDTSMHPMMTHELIKLFNDEKSNPKNAQLIFASHDVTCLDSELFRRDQIWLTEKDSYGATVLYSLSEFDYKKVRSDIPFDKWYLSGRFGALPVFGNLKDWIKNAQKKSQKQAETE